MRARANILLCRGCAVAILIGLARLAAAESPSVTPIAPQAIEADWLRQDALRERPGVATPGASVATAEQDAVGGCDGLKEGKWGFHTENQRDPWWRVDLGQARALDHLLLFNRCDGMAERNARIVVLLSEDDKAWRQVYQHNGTVFYGHSDGKPLRVDLKGATARYVRLQLLGQSYFHLDEVEVYGPGDAKNVALGRPATQSSTSQWSAVHSAVGTPVQRTYATAKTIERGLKLADDLQRRGVAVDNAVATLRDCQTRLEKLAAGASEEIQRKLFFEARWAVRRLALGNPLLDFDSILFVKHAPSRFPHMSDQFYGWWSRPGGGVFILERFSSAEPKLRCLTSQFAEGSFLRPELSYEGDKVLFAYAKYYPKLADEPNKADKRNVPEDAFYHIFEMNLDGSGCRQLTRGKYDDFDARYLPNGDIAFLSTRKGVALQCTQASAELTRGADLPDSYVRCGGDNYRPVPVFTLHAINGDGGNLRPISSFENFEWTPAVAHDGRLLYTRWDYIDRFNGHFFSLWSTNPDGTNPQLVYGNYTVRPQVKFEARSIPNSQKFIFTAGPHHSTVGGSLVLLDRGRGTEESAAITRLTPEVPFPETEAWADMYYANPYPLAEEHYLVSWSDRKLPPHCRVDDTAQNPVNALGIYLYDSFGNLNLLYRDPAISSMCPVPVRARPRPPARPDAVAWKGPQEGVLMLQDVYQGMPGIERGTVKRLRVVGVPPKPQPHMNQPSLGISAEDPGKFVLGTVPVDADGSAHFRVPSGVPLLFQALDQEGLAIQTMRSLTYVQPQQTLSCIGCHESREAAPLVNRPPTAMVRGPSRLTLGPPGSWPLRFDELVQPVLDKQCVGCHSPASKDKQAARFDLTAAHAYGNLLNFADKDLHRLAFERDRSVVGEMPARKSKLWAMLTGPKPHYDTRLDAASIERLATWMDLYAQRSGHYSPQQEDELRKFRTQLAPMLENEARLGP